MQFDGVGKLPRGLWQIFDWDWLNGVGQREAEDAGVEVQLGLERPLDGFGFAEAVLLAFEGQVRHWQPLRAQRLNHLLRLRRWNHAVFEPLEQDHRT